MTTKASLYDHLNPAAIRSVTENFYQKVLADEMLAPYFRDVDMRRLVTMQAAFLTKAFGGPDLYTDRDLRQAHAGLTGLDDQHFDKVLGHLADSLREAGVGETDIASAAASPRASAARCSTADPAASPGRGGPGPAAPAGRPGRR